MEIGTERTESVQQTCLVSIMNPPTLWVQMRDLGVWRCKIWICFLACKPLIENITWWGWAEGRASRDSGIDTGTTYHSLTANHTTPQTTHSATTLIHQITKLPLYHYRCHHIIPNRYMKCQICLEGQTTPYHCTQKTLHKAIPYQNRRIYEKFHISEGSFLIQFFCRLSYTLQSVFGHEKATKFQKLEFNNRLSQFLRSSM